MKAERGGKNLRGAVVLVFKLKGRTLLYMETRCLSKEPNPCSFFLFPFVSLLLNIKLLIVNIDGVYVSTHPFYRAYKNTLFL